jgi:hypothetical protein
LAFENLLNIILINKENIILIIAVWGAVLSSYILLSDFQKNIKKIKVNIYHGFISGVSVESSAVITMEAINLGYRNVKLASMGFILPDNQKVVLVQPKSNLQFPYTLSEGEKCNVWKEVKEFSEELKTHGYSGEIKLVGYYENAVGKVFKSKKFDFTIESESETAV